MDKSNPSVNEAYKDALKALKNAHSPYSGLQVACAIQRQGAGSADIGVNVENASYGGTICAERSAVVSMVSQYGVSPIEFVVVVSSLSGDPIPPCGLCLQVLSEFLDSDCPIFLGNAQGLQEAVPAVTPRACVPVPNRD